MKRKLYGDSEGGASLYGRPALESTALLDSGGLTLATTSTTFKIGAIPDFNINASLSSGTRLFQYNRFYWNNEYNTFPYSSCAVGLALSYFDGSTSTYKSAIYPIFLPRCCLTTIQNLSNNPEEDPRNRLLLMKELVYYLNLGFTSYGGGNGRSNASFPTAVVPPAFSPWVYTKTARGPVPENFSSFPFFRDSALPPLRWTIDCSNRHIVLQCTGSSDVPDGSIVAFNLMNLENFMLSSINKTFWTGFTWTNTLILPNVNKNSAAENLWKPDRGWCVEGAFCSGFVPKATYGPLNTARQTYDDDYTTQQRQAFFDTTAMPTTSSGTAISSVDFQTYCNTHQLRYVLGGASNNGFKCIIAKFTCNLLPSRFFVVKSTALTRNQKRPVVSNNPAFQGTDTIGIQYLSLNGRRTWIDFTLSGTAGGSTVKKVSGGGSKDGFDDTTVVSLDPMQSILNIDLALEDEWGNVLSNYYPLTDNIAPFVFGRLEGEYYSPTTMPVPLVYQPLCPNFPASFNYESLLVNENWFSQSSYGNEYVSGFSGRTNTLEESYLPQFPVSSTIIHFGRVTGY